MLAVSEGFAQTPQAGPQIVERSLVVAIAPKERGQLPAPLTGIWAERKIRKKGLFPFAERLKFLTSGNCTQFETAEQAQRPAG